MSGGEESAIGTSSVSPTDSGRPQVMGGTSGTQSAVVLNLRDIILLTGPTASGTLALPSGERQAVRRGELRYSPGHPGRESEDRGSEFRRHRRSAATGTVALLYGHEGRGPIQVRGLRIEDAGLRGTACLAGSLRRGLGRPPCALRAPLRFGPRLRRLRRVPGPEACGTSAEPCEDTRRSGARHCPTSRPASRPLHGPLARWGLSPWPTRSSWAPSSRCTAMASSGHTMIVRE